MHAPSCTSRSFCLALHAPSSSSTRRLNQPISDNKPRSKIILSQSTCSWKSHIPRSIHVMSLLSTWLFHVPELTRLASCAPHRIPPYGSTTVCCTPSQPVNPSARTSHWIVAHGFTCKHVTLDRSSWLHLYTPNWITPFKIIATFFATACA
jgi:hypothetical protein